MDQYPPAPVNPPLNPKPNRLHALAFLEVGLFELGFVVIVLMLLFGLLNYFNILPVSDVFPQLSWLPQREGSTVTSQQFNNLTIQQSAIPIPTPFQYDTARAETLLTQYIKDTLKPELIPATIEIKQALPPPPGGNTHFWLYFNTKNATTTVNYDAGKSSPNFFNSLIQPTVSKETLTPSLANSLIGSYFKNAPTVASCNGTQSINCESFQTTDTGKQGFGVYSSTQSSQKATFIYSCFIPKESEKYETAASCIGLR